MSENLEMERITGIDKQVLRLRKAGLSVMEISRKLRMSVGQVLLSTKKTDKDPTQLT